MDYEKKYNEAMLRAEEAVQKGCLDKDMFDIIFPSEESEDEKTRKDLVNFILYKAGHLVDEKTEHRFVTYLERQKEQKPSINIDQLKSLMLQYLQEAANEKDDSDIEADTDKWARKILGYDFEQKPAEWSEEDELMILTVIQTLETLGGRGTTGMQIDWLKSLRPSWNCSMIQWTGKNLREVIDFTGKSPKFNEWFKSWDEFESYVHSHGDIVKLFGEDGSHYEVPIGAWIIKTPDGYNIPSRFKFIQKPSWSERR